MALDLVAVVSVAVNLHKLAATLFADVALFAILVTVLWVVARFTSGTFHLYSMQYQNLYGAYRTCNINLNELLKHLSRFFHNFSPFMGSAAN